VFTARYELQAPPSLRRHFVCVVRRCTRHDVAHNTPPHYQNTGAGHDHGERGTRGTIRVLLRNRQLNNAMLPCDNRIIISAVAGEGICN
jgi:hypothetical protein